MINLGTNDFIFNDPSQCEFSAAYLELLGRFLEHTPSGTNSGNPSFNSNTKKGTFSLWISRTLSKKVLRPFHRLCGLCYGTDLDQAAGDSEEQVPGRAHLLHHALGSLHGSPKFPSLGGFNW